EQATTQSMHLTADLAAFAGKSVRLRIASANNQGKLIVAVDNVRLTAQFTDTKAPVLSGLAFRNQSFQSDLAMLRQTTDPTLVGQVTDNGSANNLSRVEIDVLGDGFGGPDDVVVKSFDAFGRFSVTLPDLPTGINSVAVRAVDKAGNAS